MNRYSLLVVFVLLMSDFICTVPLLCQGIVDPEKEYARIKDEALKGNLEVAAADARRLVNSYPSYGDARILLGRILAWQKNYKDGEAVIDTLLMTEPGNADALSAKNDIIRWSAQKPVIETGLRAGYSFDTFSEPYNRYWQIFKAGAEHRFKWGLVGGGVNVGNAIISDPEKSTATEFQVEAEAFPKLSEKNYAYLAYAYSPGVYFPGHRAAAELWQTLPKGWALSAGLNYYYFDRNIFIATASLEKYLGKYWLSLRGYLYFKDDGPTASGFLTVRRYSNDFDYLQLTLGAGTAPDEPFDVQTDLMRYSAYSVRMAYNKAIAARWRMQIGAGYSYEEYAENFWRNRFEGYVNFVYGIKIK